MFRLMSERTAWWPVVFAGVSEEGEVVENRIELRFRILGEDEFAAFQARAGEMDLGDAAAGAPVSARVCEVLLPIVADWRGVGAENGEALPFHADAFARLINLPNVGAAIGRAYTACRTAQPETRTGN